MQLERAPRRRADVPSGCGYSGICSLSGLVVNDTSMPRRHGILHPFSEGVGGEWKQLAKMVVMKTRPGSRNWRWSITCLVSLEAEVADGGTMGRSEGRRRFDSSSRNPIVSRAPKLNDMWFPREGLLCPKITYPTRARHWHREEAQCPQSQQRTALLAQPDSHSIPPSQPLRRRPQHCSRIYTEKIVATRSQGGRFPL